jgi:hypothetical protein
VTVVVTIAAPAAGPPPIATPVIIIAETANQRPTGFIADMMLPPGIS